MDKLAKQLRADAALIDVQVSDELERRITASLHGLSPEGQEPPTIQQRPAAFWWASSLTGVAAALIVIAVINSQSRLDEAPTRAPEISPIAVLTTPIIDWKTESAMLTSPLRKELEDLQADIKKAEQKVKEDIGL
ncbi:MAG: hypothetical protein IH838_12425 [Proteobacteria bacterium]|nr:hypothetical protein [Pseudomonadota bacterium]